MDGFCLGQKKVEENPNEITAIPQLLDTIQVKGNVITIDAMGTQTEIAEKIKQNRADNRRNILYKQSATKRGAVCKDS